ncbi:MAG: hypothetical protein WCF85_07405 [Rhodospirillaceae bacterium]
MNWTVVDAAIPAEDVIRHHIRLFGYRDDWHIRFLKTLDLTEPNTGAGVTVVLNPTPDICLALGVLAEMEHTVPLCLDSVTKTDCPARLRTLHASLRLTCADGEAIVRHPDGSPAWLWIPRNQGGVLVIGTDLAGDLVRYRQGDPAQAGYREESASWGFEFERPNYLYLPQCGNEAPGERHADQWAMLAAKTLARYTGTMLEPLLPGGAPGAVVVTGDDDQAFLEKYVTQLAELNGLPITYFLHPLTRHNPASLRQMNRRQGKIELGLHPDALTEPHRYGPILDEQAKWFADLTGRRATGVRNHGYLNDGYWGHLPHWQRNGLMISSNIPGVDGRVVTGSLLPARVVYEGALTKHWSIVTVIGDGVVFLNPLQQNIGEECVFATAQAIRESGIPGVMVVNLHPQNVSEAIGMHRAIIDVVRSGFHVWTLGDCIAWFAARDDGKQGGSGTGPVPPWTAMRRWLSAWTRGGALC